MNLASSIGSQTTKLSPVGPHEIIASNDGSSTRSKVFDKNGGTGLPCNARGCGVPKFSPPVSGIIEGDNQNEDVMDGFSSIELALFSDTCGCDGFTEENAFASNSIEGDANEEGSDDPEKPMCSVNKDGEGNGSEGIKGDEGNRVVIG